MTPSVGLLPHDEAGVFFHSIRFIIETDSAKCQKVWEYQKSALDMPLRSSQKTCARICRVGIRKAVPLPR